MIKILNTISLYIIPVLITIILVYAMFKKTPTYEAFVEGAKGGFDIAIKIIPYLIAILAFRASGAIDIIGKIFEPILNYFKIPTENLIIMITRSLSGSATLGVLADIIKQTGADSYATKLAAVITGSSETTFYVAAVYFGSVGIKKFRHALLAGILADITGLIAAIWICSIFFL